jgi:hypothetical protein
MTRACHMPSARRLEEAFVAFSTSIHSHSRSLVSSLDRYHREVLFQSDSRLTNVAILRDFFPPPTINLVSSDSEEQAEDEEGSEQAHEPLPSSSDEEEETSAVPPWAAAAGKTREQLDAEEHARQLAHTHFGQAVWYPQEPTDLTPFEFIRKKAA